MENKAEINIVDLIEKNPITRIPNINNDKLINKIKNNFTSYQQQLFLASFYCYINYNPKTDFVIDFDNFWKWIGFSSKDKAKRLLVKSFIKDIDYVILLTPKVEQKSQGGHNREIIMLSIKTFKSFCLKALTQKADEIHNYFIKLEEIIHEIMNEESNELIKQLIEKDELLKKEQMKSIEEKKLVKEKTLLEQFPKNTQSIYYGIVDNKSTKGETLIKFGNSNDLRSRVDLHKKTYDNFILINAFKVQNKIHIENEIKNHSVLKSKRRNILIDNKNYTELLAIDDFTFEEVDNMIKTIITETEYNIENYNKILQKNEELELSIKKYIEENKILMEKNILLENNLKEYTPNSGKEEKISKRKESQIGKLTYTSIGYLLYAFQCKENRFKCGVSRHNDIENKEKMFKAFDPEGSIVLTTKINYVFMEKIVSFLLKERLIYLTNDTYDGSIEDIKLIYEIACSIEEHLIDNKISLNEMLDKFKNQILIQKEEEYNDPEVPIVRKSKRAVDQINPNNGEIIASYESIEAAGRAIGLTTGTAIGVALRNKTICKGFLFRYSGISPEDQYTDQPVIKICCNTGCKTYFKNIADAAKDCNISAPGLRNRILTKVHLNDYHWIFDKESTHYK
jgi:hypothetical protein